MASKSSMKDFEVLNKLGQGSFGTVFKVRRKVDKNYYVMKMINISQMDRRGQQESINEVKILASLDFPYIVKYFDSFIENKTLHIVMEYCDKGDLSQAIRNQMGRLLPEPKIWKFFIQMCLGLEYIHSRKILHRDIKSMNVFLVRDDVIRIGDLGVAKVLANTAAFAHTMVGTPYYLSPELCEEKPYNVKSDVWALGCVLYELCTLKHPFDAINQGALLLKIIKGTYISISTMYSQELREMVDACLCKDYRKRPNIPAILNRPGMKEKAISFGIVVPPSSVMGAIGISKEPVIVYQSQMSVIEEEKVSVSKQGIKSQSPGPAKGMLRKERPSEKELRVPNGKPTEDLRKDIKLKAPEKPKIPEFDNKAKVPEKPKIPEFDNKAKVPEKPKIPEFDNKKVPEKPKIPEFDNKAKIPEKSKIPEFDNKAKVPEKPKIPEQDFKKIEVKKFPVKQFDRKESVDKPAEINIHYNNIQFNPPKPAEIKPDNKVKQFPIKSTPKNILNKPDVKLQPKVQGKNEVKVIKSGIQAPHFMPPQRPSDLKVVKNSSNNSSVTQEEKEVQELPDYKRNKKPSIAMFKPVLLKIEQIEFDPIQKPIFEDLPFMFEEFGETIDWNFTRTGFSTKETIPVTSPHIGQFASFQVNYAKNSNVKKQSNEDSQNEYEENGEYEEEEEGEDDDELYYSSLSEEEFNEGEEITEEEDLQSKLENRVKAYNEAVRLESERRLEIVKRVGKETYLEMYQFFKEKASVRDR